jgi:hypothetical protein
MRASVSGSSNRSLYSKTLSIDEVRIDPVKGSLESHQHEDSQVDQELTIFSHIPARRPQTLRHSNGHNLLHKAAQTHNPDIQPNILPIRLWSCAIGNVLIVYPWENGRIDSLGEVLR